MVVRPIRNLFLYSAGVALGLLLASYHSSCLADAKPTNVPVALLDDAGNVLENRIPRTISRRRPIVLGQSGVMTGNLLPYQRSINNGILACIKKVNAEGGVQGRKLQLRCFNNNNNPFQAINDVNRLKNEGVDIFIGNTGARNIQALLPMVKRREIAVLFPWGSRIDTDNQRLPYFVHGNSHVQAQIRRIVHYVVRELQHSSIGIVHSDNIFGKANLEFAKRTLKAYGAEPTLVTTYNSKTLDIEQALKDLDEKKPRAIIFLSTSKPTSKIIKHITNNGCYATDMVGIEANLFVPRLLDNSSIQFCYASAVPDINKTEYQIVKEYVEAMNNNLPNERKDILSLMYYINTKILCQALANVAEDEKPVNRESVVDALEKIHYRNIGGFIADFNRKTRTAYPITVSIVKG